MNKTFGLVSVLSVNEFLAFIKPIWRELAKAGTPIILKLSTKAEVYTTAQRRLYWQWVGQFADKFGMNKDEVHLDIKRRFLINIYYANDPEYASMCDAIALLKRSESDQYEAISKGVIRETSITRASKVEMTQFMDQFYRFAMAQGCALACPDDLKYLREATNR